METAMDVVRRGQRGEIDHDELVRILKTWPYEPQYRTTGLADDWEIVDNSFDAVELAHISLNLLTEADYAAIASAAPTATDRSTQDGWVYKRSPDGSARFVLGTVGEHPLVCFGINPSTAKPGALDPTVKRVARFAAENGFDSWAMLNVYPQVATDPKLMDREYRQEFKLENERHIARLINGRPLTLLAAWGGLVTSRPYLRTLLEDILTLTSIAGCRWVCLGDPTKNGHPRHPLYVKADTPLVPYDIHQYVDRP